MSGRVELEVEMSEQAPAVEMSEEEAAKKLAEAQAFLAKQVQRGKKQFAYNIKLAKDRLAYATRELAEVEGKGKALEPVRDRPEGAYHATNMELLRHAYASMKRMMEIQLEANQHNLAIVETDPMPTNPAYRVPDQELNYLEARGYMTVAFGMFLWIQLAEGVETILRASGQAGTIQGGTEEDEANRQAQADALRQATGKDRNLAITLGQWGSELQDAYRLIEWGKATLGRLAELSPEEKRTALEVGDWGKLNARVTFLGELPGKVKPYPAAAALFPNMPAVAMPFDPIQWSETPEATGTDRLQRSGSQPLPKSGPDPRSEFKRSGGSDWGT
jgi:hypothetical protein